MTFMFNFNLFQTNIFTNRRNKNNYIKKYNKLFACNTFSGSKIISRYIKIIDSNVAKLPTKSAVLKLLYF